MRLYEYANELRATIAQLEAMGDDIPPEVIRDTIEAASGDFEEKAAGVAAFALNCEAEHKAIQDAIDRMQARQVSLLNKAENARKYLAACMESVKRDEIRRPEFVISLAKTPGAVNLTDESKVPDRFYVVVPPVPESKKLDKASLLKALRAGEQVSGATLHVETRVRIK